MMYFLIIGFCALIMISIGCYALRKPEPMWFWAGSEEELEKQSCTDVAAYNRKNGWMWILYGLSFFLPMLIHMFWELPQWVFLILLITDIVGGMIGMVVYYEHLHTRYMKPKKT